MIVANLDRRIEALEAIQRQAAETDDEPLTDEQVQKISDRITWLCENDPDRLDMLEQSDTPTGEALRALAESLTVSA